MSRRHGRPHELTPCRSIQSAPSCQAEIERAQIVLNAFSTVILLAYVVRYFCYLVFILSVSIRTFYTVCLCDE